MDLSSFLSDMPTWWLVLMGIAVGLNIFSAIVLLAGAKITRDTKKAHHGFI